MSMITYSELWNRSVNLFYDHTTNLTWPVLGPWGHFWPLNTSEQKDFKESLKGLLNKIHKSSVEMVEIG